MGIITIIILHLHIIIYFTYKIYKFRTVLWLANKTKFHLLLLKIQATTPNGREEAISSKVPAGKETGQKARKERQI